MTDWVKIYLAGQPHQAEIVLAVLEDHNIEAQVIDKRDSSYLFGNVEIYVDQRNAEEARRIIAKNEL